MILVQDRNTLYWNRTEDGKHRLRHHPPDQCSGRLCDVHNRRGSGPQASWPLNWNEFKGIMEVICKHDVAHPTQAQFQYVVSDKNPFGEDWYDVLAHGCCGCCEEES